jgi:hypothetical protein
MFLRRLALLALPAALVLTGCSSLYSVSVSPAAGAVSINVGQTAQFRAFGASQMGSGTPTTAEITSSVQWSVVNPSVASINSSGVATGLAAGHTIVNATSNGITASSDITVTSTGSGSGAGSGSPYINITPGAANDTFLGETTQFIATGSLTGGASQSLTGQVQWSSTNVQVATITSGGLATAVGAGTTTITAQSGGTVSTATLTVTVGGTNTNATLNLIPTSATASFVGETTQFVALGNLSGGTATQDLTSSVSWSSSDVSVATVDRNGLATAVGAVTGIGTTTITATGTTGTGSLITATATLTVNTLPGTVTLPTLSVYLSGSGTGVVTSSTIANGTTITCGSASSGATCTGSYPLSTVVTLTAAPSGTSKFGGWSSNCLAVTGPPPNPLQCTVQMSNNKTVGAVFNP